ncbi:MAG: DUF2325 domain-containing protein [Nitrosospira sp.]|nr:DUF2325 domain-containing protein [Nitrosospira sp.]
MEQLSISAASGDAVPFLISDAPYVAAVLFNCLRTLKAIAVYQESDPGTDTAGGIKRPNAYNSITHGIQELVEKKAAQFLGRFLGTYPSAILTPQASPLKAGRATEFSNESPLVPAERARAGPGLAEGREGHRELPEHVKLELKLADTGNPARREIDMVPLVKVLGSHSAASLESAWDRDNCDEKKLALRDDFDLAGRCILCVGGRAALYPEYCRMVEASGGSLLLYRCGARTGVDHLPALLAHTDMVICPVDCINHHDYFTVKRYCKRSGKLCVLLHRSNLRTFHKGVATLAALAASAGLAAAPGDARPVQGKSPLSTL